VAAGATFEQAAPAKTEYDFATPGHVVTAEGVSWLSIEGEALSLAGSEPGCWTGGLVDGPYDATSVYECNRTHCPSTGCPSPCLAYHTSACMAPESSGGQTIEDFACAHYGDGISRELESGDLVIRRAHLRELNDDAIEDDYGLSNTRVFDSLLDGVNIAFGDRQRSSQDNDATGTEWEVRGSLVRVRANANPYKQRPGYGGIWKGDRNPSHQHRYRVTGNVFVAQGVKEGGLLFPVAGYVDECAGNVLLWAGPISGEGGFEATLAEEDGFADGLSEGERLAALNAAFPDCFRVVVKPESQGVAEFLDTPLAELGDRSWSQLVAGWGGANAAPAVVLGSPVDGTAVDAGAAVEFLASASDPEDGDLSAALSWHSSLAGPLGSGASFTRADLPVGTHGVTASVTDAGGRTGAAGVTLIVRGPNGAPDLAIHAPVDGARFPAGQPISFTASATDAEDGDLAPSVVWSSSLGGPLGSGASLTLANLAVGTHLVTATVADSGGLAASAAVTLTIDAKPVVSITSPPNGVTVKAGTPLLFAASATDLEDGNLSAAVVWTSSRQGALGTGASLLRALETKGTHVITARVIDSAGGVAQAQVTVRVR
jgi:hypothetical protein